MSRAYRLGRRQTSIDDTARRILAAARRQIEMAPSAQLSVGAVARDAGVTRATVYNRFGSRSGLLRALEPAAGASEPASADPREALHQYLAAGAARWAATPALFRHLQPHAQATSEVPRVLAERLAAADALRPGCSLKEAEDVLAALSSFAVFDSLHRDGRRSASAVTEILMRLAGGILA